MTTAKNKQNLSPKSLTGQLTQLAFTMIAAVAIATLTTTAFINSAHASAAKASVDPEVLAGLIEGIVDLGQHDKDCDQYGDMLHQAAFPNNVDNRREVDDPVTEAPFAAAVGVQGSSDFEVMVNGIQFEDPQILVLPAHELKDKESGKWVDANGLTDSIEGKDPGLDVKLAGCPGETYKISEVVHHKNYTYGHMKNDVVVAILDRPSCLKKSQVAQIGIPEKYEEDFLLPGGKHRKPITLYAHSYRPLVGKDKNVVENNVVAKNAAGKSHSETSAAPKNWPLSQSVVSSSGGFVEGILYYEDLGGGGFRTLTEQIYKGENPRHGRVMKVSTSHAYGNSGGCAIARGPVRLKNNNPFELDHCIGMVIGHSIESETDVENYILPANTFWPGIEKAYDRLAELSD